jgi:hypothetical protein
MEEYEGPKFVLTRTDRTLPEVAVKRYLELDARLREFLDPKENEGNMSMRLDEGFLVKRAGARMTELGDADVSWVLEAEEKVVAAGAEPSSEARMHHEIYKANPGAMIILHFHDDERLGTYEGPSIGPFPYGTLELAKASGEIAKTESMFMIKGHGFVMIAKDEESLLEMMRSWKRL